MLTGNGTIGPYVRRKRPVISCRECHRRKQKCDRRQPCANCIRRGKRDACYYELEDNDTRSTVPPENQSIESVSESCWKTVLATSNNAGDEFARRGYAKNTKGTPGIIHALGESASLLDNSHPRNGFSPGQYIYIIRELPS
ncbi:Ff.00g066660.m01.CDS01 [Fusarium sp. VM40]|nr:Ff.00g066660.m01.CDS01 [Fusarium sp. VM40]